jgi:hypothetical protein
MFSTRRIILAIVIAGALAIPTASTAFAYGGGQAAYQITFSFNCMNKLLCQPSLQNPFGVGGFWGWIELSNDGTGDGEMTGQGHSNPNPALNGAFHMAPNDITWQTTMVGSAPMILINIPELGGPFLEVPAASGHYSSSMGPGTNSQIQVSRAP